MNSYSPAIACLLTLAAWLAGAVWFDLRERRIPNSWVAAGLVCGVALQALAPAGAGLFDRGWGGLGLLQALLGAAAGLALFMPLYVLRALGAGDVKLLAMVGAWLGPQLLLGATLLTLLFGGALSLVVMLASRSSREVLGNVRVMLTTTLLSAQVGRFATLDAPSASRVRLPYAVAIALGTLGQLGWQLYGAR
jgi:prepilin peptidase CpaA